MSLRLRRGTVGTLKFEEGEPVFDTSTDTLYIGKGISNDPVEIAGVADIVSASSGGTFEGAVTFESDITVSSSINIDVQHQRPDHTATGPQTNTLNAGYNCLAFDLVYLGSSSTWLELTQTLLEQASICWALH